MQHSAERNREAALDCEDERINELGRYHALSDLALEEAVSAQMIQLDVYLAPEMEEAEQTVRDMEDLFDEALAVTPDMEDELSEARIRWQSAKTKAQIAADILDDLMQVQFIREQAWATSSSN